MVGEPQRVWIGQNTQDFFEFVWLFLVKTYDLKRFRPLRLRWTRARMYEYYSKRGSRKIEQYANRGEKRVVNGFANHINVPFSFWSARVRDSLERQKTWDWRVITWKSDINGPKKNFSVSFNNMTCTAIRDVCCKQSDFCMKRTRDLQTFLCSQRLRIDQ